MNSTFVQIYDLLTVKLVNHVLSNTKLLFATNKLLPLVNIDVTYTLNKIFVTTPDQYEPVVLKLA